MKADIKIDDLINQAEAVLKRYSGDNFEKILAKYKKEKAGKR